jgi:hypothetical protein
MLRKTPSELKGRNVFKEIKNEFSPHFEQGEKRIKGFFDQHPRPIFIGMVVLIIGSFIISFFLIPEKSESPRALFNDTAKGIPTGVYNEFSAIKDLTERASRMNQLRSEIEILISKDTLKKDDSVLLEKAITELEFFNNQTDAQ